MPATPTNPPPPAFWALPRPHRWRIEQFLLLALLLRLGWIGLQLSLRGELPVPLAGGTRDLAGTDGYLQLARTLLTEARYAFTPEGAPVHHRPPLTPLLMTACAWATTHWALLWWGFTALMGLGTVALGGRWTRQLGLRPRQGFFLLLLLSVHPLLVAMVWPATALSVGSFVMALVLTAWLAYRTSPVSSRAVFLGGSLGLALLTHASLQGPVLLVLGAILMGSGRRPPALGQRAVHALLALLVLGGLLLPWLTFRAETGSPWPLYTGAGLQYWIAKANWTDQPGLPERRFEQATGHRPALRYFGTTQPADSRRFRDLALHDFRQQPGDALLRWVGGLWHYWVPQQYNALKAWVAALFNLPLLALALADVLRRPRRHLDLLLPWLGLWLGSALFVPQTAYCTMALPWLAAYAFAQMARPGHA